MPYGTDQLGRIGGFSLHAGVTVNTRERKKLERIYRGGLPPNSRYRESVTPLSIRKGKLVTAEHVIAADSLMKIA